jgi:hypothetical protein
MKIMPHELATLNLYCTSALFSAWRLGQMARRAHDPRLRLDLARRAADALRHAEIWAETIRAVGGRPSATAAAYQTLYSERLGKPDTLLHVLALSEVFERRLARQLLRHFHRSDIDPTVRATLRRMIEEELQPQWATRWLESQAETDTLRVRAIQRQYAEADAVIPDPDAETLHWPMAA